MNSIAKEKKPIFLTGFSGSGKSSIGQSLAFKLNRNFFDLDKEVELLSGKVISKLIEEDGESFFRDLESQIINSLSLTTNSIIALGGGSLIRKSNVDLIKRVGYLIYLHSDINNIINNLRVDNQVRPLIRDLNKDEIEKLFEQRKEGYLKADLCFYIKDQTVREAADNLSQRLMTWQKKQNLI